MNSKSPVSVAASIGLLLFVAVLWFFFAPRPLGGPVSYVVTDGISMQPELHEGDLVIVREANNYEIGDVVAYESESLGRVVLHRIIDVDGDRYIFQGDNNDFVDQDEPTVDALIGKEWIVLPGVGKALAWVGEPVNAGLLAGAVTLLILGGSFGLGRATRRRDRRERQARPPAVSPSHAGSVSTASLIAGALLAIFLIGTAFLFGLSSRTEEQRNVSYRNEGSFAYTADAEPSAVYPDGELRTGEPIFMNLVDELNVRFNYNFASEAEHSVSGVIGLTAEVSDSTGWKRSLPLADATGFEGSTGRVEGVLDLRRIRRLVSRIQTLTGVQQPTYTLAIQPRVQVSGRIQDRTVEEVFTPSLSFQFDHLKLTLLQPSAASAGEEPVNPLSPVQEGSVEITESTEKRIAIGPAEVPVQALRWLALAAALLAAVGLAVAQLGRGEAADEATSIRKRYGAWIVDVASVSASAERKAVEMKTIHDLAALAGRYDRAILHDEQDGIHSYIVEEEGIAYWYQAFPEKVRVARPDNVAVIGQGRSQHVVPANADVVPGGRSR